MSRKLTYRDAGVDIDAMDRALRDVRTLARSTATPGVLSSIGGFGGLFDTDHHAASILVASVDGVGTKLRVALEAGVHDTVGGDLVNHCVNDILVQGAEPLFFMDYFASGRLDPATMVDVVRGIATACRHNGCALLGGETAEMPGFYQDGDYDLAGFIVGRVERSRLLTGDRIAAGDRLLGLPSVGLHTNGFSLARKILFEVRGLAPGDRFPGTDRSVADTLLAPHRSYLACIRPLLEDEGLHGLAHITGGGLSDNLPRVLPDGLMARIDRAAWKIPEPFASLQTWGGVETGEMFRAFNMGVGMVAVVGAARETDLAARLVEAGETVIRLGDVAPGSAGVTYVGEG
ncbi:MAG: phosphoribosylformylglycinamidine cyclo-ligase [Acidobacteriota bacterium]